MKCVILDDVIVKFTCSMSAMSGGLGMKTNRIGQDNPSLIYIFTLPSKSRLVGWRKLTKKNELKSDVQSETIVA
jgi:hypothetical protein